MELEETNINIRTKVFRELYSLTWCIESFDTLPYRDDLQVRSPSFLLGKHKNTTWNMVLSKQMHQEMENVGFRFDRGDDHTDWNMAVVTLSVMLQDGRLIKCIDEKVFYADSRFEFLIQPSEPQQASVENRMDAYIGDENGCGQVRSVEGPKIQDVRTVRPGVIVYSPKAKLIEVVPTPKVDSDHDPNEAILMNLLETQPLSITDIYRLRSTLLQNQSFSFDNTQKSNDQEENITKPTTVNGPPTVEKSRYLKLHPKFKACRPQEHEVLKSEAPENGVELTSEDLLTQKDLTVVCKIDYTYETSTDLATKNEQQSVQPDLMNLFKYLHATGVLSDVTMECAGNQLLCHKVVLCYRSEILKKLLQYDGLPSPLVVTLNIQLHIAKAFLLYMYTNEFPDIMSEEDCGQLCHVAVYFGVQEMKDKCMELMRLKFTDSDLEEVDARLDKNHEKLIWIELPSTEQQ